MSLLGRLNDDMKQAMKNKQKEKLTVIRMVKAALQNEGIKLQHTLTEEEELTVLAREVKQYKDSLLEFKKAGREDLVDKLQSEIRILSAYLPEQLTEEELANVIKQVISEVGATSKADMGKVMTAVMPKVKGKTDGSLVNKLVIQLLA
ncbi:MULTISPECIES: GatB/YqeY domain-containing protein [Bacillus]|uniref:GatB/YqeY domain-containing protein n=2 Tax=Bacillus cereus group TaxID=86661 RepID=A0A2B0XAD5_BACAN|nr:MULTISPECIES: GatB/YqeY domain-containing protein [Bacillus]MCU0095388.1 GatB/YqeY domain-containing protein [Bacillus sp. OR9]KZD34462.1 Transamidase GatB domain protein [Bacillus cereus]MBJ8057369.1 GatB/YqeY domain-containing protein [Bacillus cereus]MCU4755138.1 GatB/YqeY domain-containing protein [Bacillus cereus]MCU5104828.1 GatB/YqeY domain-containing protein [Bacillus cereus]